MNNDIKNKKLFNILKGIKIFLVEKDENDTVAKKFVEKNDKLKRFLSNA